MSARSCPLPTRERAWWPARPAAVLLALASLGVGCAASRPARRAPDRTAIRDATAGSPEDRYASSRAYLHFLQALLAAHDGLSAKAIGELETAIVFDPESPYLRVALAEMQLRAGHEDAAEAALEAALRADPRYGPAHLAMGKLRIDQRRRRQAVLSLERAIAAMPGEAEAYLHLAQVHLELEEEPKAVAAIDALAKARPGDPVGYKALGRWFAERSEHSKALRYLQLAHERDPGDRDVLLLLARSSEAEGAVPEAIGYYEKALARDPDDPSLMIALGSLLLQRGDAATARAYFDRVLAALPNDPDLRAKLAFSYVRANRLQEAADFFAQAQALAPADANLAFFLGRVLEQLRQWRKASAAFAAVPEASELYPQAISRRVRSLSHAGDHAEATALAERALKADPGRLEYELALASALERAGRRGEAIGRLERALRQRRSAPLVATVAELYVRAQRGDDALRLLREGLELAPRDEVLLYTLGVVHERLGDRQASLARMRELLAVNPEHADAMNFIGYSWAEQGERLDEAEALIKRALRLQPDNGAFLDSLGWVHFQRGDYAKASEVLRRACELQPEEPAISEHLGDAYVQLGKAPEALEAYRGALESLRRLPDAVVQRRIEAKLRQAEVKAAALKKVRPADASGKTPKRRR